MAGNDRDKNPASRIIRDRAMAVLRETRAKIDPRLLEAMKDHLTGVMAGQAKAAAAASSKLTEPPAKAAPVYPARKFEEQPETASKTEAVDRQKIALIVAQYMKNREESQKH